MNFEEYAQAALRDFAGRDPEARYQLVEAAGDIDIKRVLDIGCGPGHQLIPFAERTGAACVGVDIAPQLGSVAGPNPVDVDFVRGNGADLPFADGVFDVVICRVALPYMNNRSMLAETSRVLRDGGVFLLKTHSPRFYFAMIKERAKTMSLRQLAYPIICLAGSTWHAVTGKQLLAGFWKGKEVFQTERFLKRELSKNGLSIASKLPDDNPLTPSYRIVKSVCAYFFLLSQISIEAIAI